MPNKKDVIQMKDEKGKKFHTSKYVMSLTQKEAFQRFKMDHPNLKIGQRTFDKLKPRNVQRVKESSRVVCLCTPCQNISLKTDALKKILNSLPRKAENDEEKDRLGKMSKNLKRNKQELINMTVCNNEGEFPRSQCLERDCESCGSKIFRQFYKPLEEEMEDEKVEWDTWKYANVEIDGEQRRKMSLIRTSDTIAAFLDDFKSALEDHPAHLFRSTWQFKQQKEMQNMLQEGQAWIMLDFAEDFTIRHKHEVQSAYWMQEKVTIHPVYIVYPEYRDQDGARTKIVNKHSFICVSNDSTHDSHAVLTFTKAVLKHLETNNHVFHELIEFTDGAPAQYKGKTAFADVAHSEEELGMKIQRHFSETAHGKGICDGIGGLSKHTVSQAVLQERAIIRSAHDYYFYGKNHLEKDEYVPENDFMNHIQRTYLWIPRSDVSRDRPETNIKTVQGTRKIHAVKTSNDRNRLFTRNLSCFCSPCRRFDGSKCENEDYVDGWKEVILQPLAARKSATLGDPKVTDHSPVKDQVESKPISSESGVDSKDSASPGNILNVRTCKS